MPLRYSMKVPLEENSGQLNDRPKLHLPNAPLDRDVKVSNVVEDEVGELLVALFAHVVDESLGCKLFAQLVSGQAVFCERVVEHVHDCTQVEEESACVFLA